MSLGGWAFSKNEEGEWQAVHENYDGLPDGNNHLFVTGESLMEVAEKVEELTQ